MNIRKLALAALAAVGLAAAPAKAPAQFDRGIIEAVAATLLAEKLGLDPQILSGLLGGSGAGVLGRSDSLFDLGPAFALQRYAPSNRLDDMIALREQGLGWDAIADRTGVPDQQYRRLRSTGQLDNNNLWRSVVTDELNLSSGTVTQMRGMGLTWRDIVMTTLISRESGRPLNEVANRYRTDRNWSRVASRYGVTRQQFASRISAWRSRRTLPSAWARNSTRWTPPGLAKKGGIPPGQAKRQRRVARDRDDDRRDDVRPGRKSKGQRALKLRSSGKHHGARVSHGKAKKSGKNHGAGHSKGRGKVKNKG